MKVADIATQVDFVIVTFKDEESAAVLARFNPEITVIGDSKFGERQYNISIIGLPSGDQYVVAMLTANQQGNEEMVAVAKDVALELTPRLILAVGIAGMPADPDLTIGDVVVSNKILDYTVAALKPDGVIDPVIGGASLRKQAASIVANLSMHTRRMKPWNTPDAIQVPIPTLDSDSILKMPAVQEIARKAPGYFERLRAAFERLKRNGSRPPKALRGTIASSNFLHKDHDVFGDWLTERTVKAVEMEAAGGLRGASEHDINFVAFRSISDIVGVPRDEDWTIAACNIAAAFTFSWINAAPIAPLPARRLFGKTSPSQPLIPTPVAANPPVSPVALDISDKWVVAHTVHREATLKEYESRSVEPLDDKAMLAILSRLNLPWREPLSSYETELLKQDRFRPGVTYPCAPYVLQQLNDCHDFLKRASDAVRSVARWPDSYRLNYVRQLSTTNLASSLDANHSRLAHCLGVVDVTACLLNAISLNSPNYLSFGSKDDREWVAATIIFAFLHDRYHGPLGHSLDPLSYALNMPAATSEPHPALHKLDKMALSTELRSAAKDRNHPIARIAQFVAQDLAATSWTIDPTSVLIKLANFVRLTSRSEMPARWRFLQDVVDSELDADRLDYLWRDTMHLGLNDPIGDELIQDLKMKDDPVLGDVVRGARAAERGADGELRLAFSREHGRAINACLLLRFLYYVKVYEHPTKRIYDELLTRVIFATLSAANVIKDGRITASRISEEMRSLTDDDLFHFLSEASSRAGHSGPADGFFFIPQMAHEIMQARPWRIIWKHELSEADCRRELELRKKLQDITRVAEAQMPPATSSQEVTSRAVAFQRSLALAAFAGQLGAFLESHGVPKQELRYTEVSAVFDLYASFHGSFESRYRLEALLWNDIRNDPDMAESIRSYRAYAGATDVAEIPPLIVLGMIRATLPSPERVFLEPETGGMTDLPVGWKQWEMSAPTLLTFVAAHPLLAHKQARLEELVEDWFRSLSYLDLAAPPT